jgi:predicted NAD-dependent protein-ADP-ribosyltransferase YbiA (DUF1768 family)
MTSKLNLSSLKNDTRKLPENLENYFISRKGYKEALRKFDSNKTKEITTIIDGKNVNLPLEFLCINNKFEIKGLDYSNDKILFTKSIYSKTHMNLDRCLKNCENEIKTLIYSGHYSNYINLVRYLSEYNSIKSDDPKKAKISSLIEESYQNSGKKYQQVVDKLQFLRNHIQNLNKNKLDKFLNNRITSTFIKNTSLNKDFTIADLSNYLISRGIINGPKYITKNALVVKKDKIENITIDDIYLVRNNKNTPENKLCLQAITGGEIMEKENDCELLDILRYDFNHSNINLTESMKDIKHSDETPMFHVKSKPTDDILDKPHVINKPKYNKNYVQKFTIEPKKKVKAAEEPQIFNYYPKYDLDFDENNKLMFYSKSADNVPGLGRREKLNEDILQLYKDALVQFKDWRKKLSNFYVYKTETKKIIPIVIDKLQFSSVEHYYHYSKFINTDLDISSSNKSKYNDYAMKFTYSGEFGKITGNTIKIKGGSRSNYNAIVKWENKMNNGLKYKDNILVKAILAKALQFNEFKEILLATGNLALIHPKGGSLRSKHSEFAYPQMIVRKIINENKDDRSSHLYSNESINKDIDLSSRLSEIEEENIEMYSYKSSSEDETQAKSKTSDKLSSSEEEIKPQSKTSVELSSSEETQSQSSKKWTPSEQEEALKRQLENAKSVLSEKEIDIESMSNEEIISKASQITSMTSINMQGYLLLKERLKEQFEFMNMPPDGNCLFYSIIEQLKLLDTYPMNFISENSDEQYSREIQNLKLIAGDMNTVGPIHYKAALQLRKDITDKMSENFKQLEKDMPSIKDDEDYSQDEKLYADLIASYRNILFTNGNIDEYLQNMSLSAKPPDKGLWGGANEIIVASALLNLNITVYQTNGDPIRYSAKESKKVFRLGGVHNLVKESNIYLLYLGGQGHYIAMRPISAIKKGGGDALEKIENISSKEIITGYKIFKYNYDQNKILNYVFVENNDDNLAPYLLGIFNANTGRIIDNSTDTKISKNLWNKLIKIANDLIDSDKINLDKLDTISYLRDITNNKIYWKNNNQEIEVGRWIGDYFEDDEKIMDKRIEFN